MQDEAGLPIAGDNPQLYLKRSAVEGDLCNNYAGLDLWNTSLVRFECTRREAIAVGL